MNLHQKAQFSLFRLFVLSALFLVPTSFQTTANDSAFLLTQDSDEENNFLDRDGLKDLLNGNADDQAITIESDIAALEMSIDDIDILITDKAAAVAAETDVDAKAILQGELDILNSDRDTLLGDLEALNNQLTDINISIMDISDKVDALSDEQVIAINRAFNGWVNNSFDVIFSDDLVERLLAGDLNDQQVRFAIKAEFELAKFNQLGDRMDEKGLTDQADRMRARGEMKKSRFDGKVDDFASDAAAESAAFEAKNSAKSAAKSFAKDNAQNAARGQAKAEAKKAAKEEAKRIAKEEAKEKAKHAAHGHDH